ncbi:T9SS type A sorting domain-containing protein [uncultured Dokdonia sp.]|uniref:T9SS type A sorting domain-containing protein n=1 Tax=uncultured Dokdonia sp. TaxID=575653 RepID=UPI002637C660|nr:T9SS type A sorting domain-containing protein [uncultured Dokdonia sp.]
MKKITYALALLSAGVLSYFLVNKGTNEAVSETTSQITSELSKKGKTPIAKKHQFAQERLEYELQFQRDPQTGIIPRDQKELEFQTSITQLRNQDISRTSQNVYTNRGPSNLGGRTRTLAIDLSDPTSNTMLAGAVSGGVFRTTDGGQSWSKVSPNSEIHNVTAIAQDPRDGFQNIWYYATGEFFGNSAAIGAGQFLGQGIWRSEDGGLNWEQIPETDSSFENFDSFFDFNHALAVSPLNGDLFIANFGRIYRYDGATLTIELQEPGNNGGFTDVVIDSSGRVYATLRGTSGSNNNGVYTSETGNGTWVRIAENGTPTGWNANASSGRIVLSTVPSNENLLYALYTNGADSGVGNIEADLWRYDASSDTWTDFSSKLPDLPGGPIRGVDPFAVQGGYDLDVTVKPDDENFVIIAGTSAYRIENIETDDEFGIIGGYNGASTNLYNQGGGDTHHPDVHSLVFDPNNTDVFFTGTDGGVHRTDNINATVIGWENLNNDYQTYQYYHVALDQVEGSNIVLGGAQDNATTIGGTDAAGVAGIFVPTVPTPPNNSDMFSLFGGDGVSVGIARRGADNDVQLYLGSQGGQIITNLPNPRDITPTGADSSIFVTYFYLDPDNTDALYYADGTRMFRTTNAAGVIPTTWEDMGNLAINQNLRQFATTRGAYNPATSYLLIGGQSGGVFKLNDPQNAADLSEAIDITPPGASTTNGTVVTGFAIHPTNPDIALAVYGNYNITNIFLTTNATSDNPTWEVVERNLSAHSIRSAAITEVNGQPGYYVGTARGLFSSPDPTNTDWSLEASDQIGMAIVSGLVYRPSDNRLLIGTHGNGMFDTEATVLSIDDFTENSTENILRVFPNPTTDVLNFRTSGTNSIAGYEIIDYTGRILDKGAIDNLSQGTINVSEYTNGVYFIRAITQNNERVTTRFIKR